MPFRELAQKGPVRGTCRPRVPGLFAAAERGLCAFDKPYEVLDPQNKSLTPEDVFAMQSNLPAFTEPRKDLIKRLRDGMVAKKIQEQMNKIYVEDEKDGLGVVTPIEIGPLLEGIEKGTIASKASCAEMARIMRGQQSGARRIPHYLSV